MSIDPHRCRSHRVESDLNKSSTSDNCLQNGLWVKYKHFETLSMAFGQNCVERMINYCHSCARPVVTNSCRHEISQMTVVILTLTSVGQIYQSLSHVTLFFTSSRTSTSSAMKTYGPRESTTIGI
ncbi:hypothetical protein QTP88_002510 [Uroleucon formosanum]